MKLYIIAFLVASSPAFASDRWQIELSQPISVLPRIGDFNSMLPGVSLLRSGEIENASSDRIAIAQVFMRTIQSDVGMLPGAHWLGENGNDSPQFEGLVINGHPKLEKLDGYVAGDRSIPASRLPRILKIDDETIAGVQELQLQLNVLGLEVLPKALLGTGPTSPIDLGDLELTDE